MPLTVSAYYMIETVSADGTHKGKKTKRYKFSTMIIKNNFT